MLSIPFYHTLLRKYVTIFGTLFNNIRIEKVDGNDVPVTSVRVPISYGPREKFLARVEENPTGIAKTAIRLPRMSFEITSMSYDPSRKLQTTTATYSNNLVAGDQQSGVKKVYTPVPYDIKFSLYVMTKQTEEALRIVEQILPYFTPEWTISAKMLEHFNQYTDIPIIIDSVDIQDTYDSDFSERRNYVWTISFTMKAYLFGPVSQSKKIKIAQVNAFAPFEANAALSRTTTQPGLTANGDPTTKLSETIPYMNVGELDNYDFIITKTDFPSG